MHKSDEQHSSVAWQPIILGHRGAKGLAPENTLAGFQCAADLGLPGVELDVHLSADGELVVIHDHFVDSTTNGTGRVEEKTLAQLRALDAGAGWAPGFRGAKIPTLEEVLRAFARRFRWEIEIKVDEQTDVPGVVGATARLIKDYDLGATAVLTSFASHALEACRRIAPGLRRGLIAASEPLTALQRALDLGCVQVGLHHETLDPEVVAAVRAAGPALVGWQGDSPAAMERLFAARVDAFSSNRPDVALDWLRQHGLKPVLIDQSRLPDPP